MGSVDDPGLLLLGQSPTVAFLAGLFRDLDRRSWIEFNDPVVDIKLEDLSTHSPDLLQRILSEMSVVDNDFLNVLISHFRDRQRIQVADILFLGGIGFELLVRDLSLFQLQPALCPVAESVSLSERIQSLAKL